MSDTNQDLKKGLNSRHIFFIALGSAIGTGLFYGSTKAISLAGPSVLITYLLSGMAVFMVMRALGEMSLHNTLSGSFGSYATTYLHPFVGFLTGWTYVLDLVLVCIADIVAVSIYMAHWYPHVAPWYWSLGVTLIIIGLNLCAVKIFGEMEFWLSLIKVIAIFAMIVGGLVIIGLAYFKHSVTVGPIQPAFSNLWKFGGFMPNGLDGLFKSFAVVVFAFGGIEIIGLAASEAQKIDKNLPRAINTVPSRILLFYIMTLAVLMSLFPWNQIGADGSPFVTIFDSLGIKKAADILNVVVISAAISAINSDVYGSARMMFGLAKDGHAPKFFTKLLPNGAPLVPVLVVFAAMLFGVYLNVYYHDQLFFIMATMATFATVAVWLIIMVCQVVMRTRMSPDEAKKLKFPIPLWPYGPILTIIFLVFVIVILAIDQGYVFMYGGGWLAILSAFYFASLYLKEIKKSKNNSL